MNKKIMLGITIACSTMLVQAQEQKPPISRLQLAYLIVKLQIQEHKYVSAGVAAIALGVIYKLRR